MAKTLLRYMTELSSRKWISQLTGKFAHSRASKHLIPRFAKIYGIPVEDAEHDLREYQTLNQFFTRRLKPGLRPVDAAVDSLTSPVDALITGMGTIDDGLIVNVKNQDYTIEQLLNRSPYTDTYKHGYYFVLYLSPTDYHRIHTPVAGCLIESEHIPGKVYPVNDFGLTHMKHVLSRNERLITYIRHACGEVAVVKVGAMNVSSIQYAQPMKNSWDKGQDLAYFEFGSTVVLLMENGTFTPRKDLTLGTKVKMGVALGTIHSKVNSSSGEQQ